MNELLLNISTIFIFLFTLILLATVIVFLFITQIPYVPSNTKELEKFFTEHKPRKNAIFYDLGCGNGKVLLLAERFNLHAIGFEIAPLPWILAKIKRFSKRSTISIHFRNFMKCDLSNADYIYCYLFPELTEKAFQKAKNECKPGSFFICNTFKLKSKSPLLTYKNKKQQTKLFIYKI